MDMQLNKPATFQPDAHTAPNTGAVAVGYRHATYARSLAEFGTPRLLPQCGGWILERRIPGTELCDAMGCYPLFACRDWSRVGQDLAAIDSRFVSLTLVADSFGDHTPELLAEWFPDVCKPFKEHWVVNLERHPEDFVCAHHRRNARKGRRSVKVEVCQRPREFLDDWTRLYDALIQRHGIRGLTAFSKQSFTLQLETPGIVALRAAHNGKTVGLLLWFVQEEVAYYHLGAFDPDGYALRASFALFWEAIEHFRAKGLRWLSLGGAAGLRDGESGLARFKRGWANGSRSAFLCGKIFDPQAYAALLAKRDDSYNSYFPAYRENAFE